MYRLKFVAVIVVVLTIVLGACGVEDSLGITPTTVPPDAARPSDGGSSSPSPLLPAAAGAAENQPAGDNRRGHGLHGKHFDRPILFAGHRVEAKDVVT